MSGTARRFNRSGSFSLLLRTLDRGYCQQWHENDARQINGLNEFFFFFGRALKKSNTRFVPCNKHNSNGKLYFVFFFNLSLFSYYFLTTYLGRFNHIFSEKLLGDSKYNIISRHHYLPSEKKYLEKYIKINM